MFNMHLLSTSALVAYTFLFGIIMWILSEESDRNSRLFWTSTLLVFFFGVSGVVFYDNYEVNYFSFLFGPFLLALGLSIITSLIVGLASTRTRYFQGFRAIFPLVWTGTWFVVMVLAIAGANTQ